MPDDARPPALDLGALNRRFDGARPEVVLKWLIRQYPGRAVFASSLSPEDMVILHLLDAVKDQTGLSLPAFTLDTGRLPEPTFALIARARQRYRIALDVVFPDPADVEALVRDDGPLAFYESIDKRRRCCHARKVAPLLRALAPYDAWVTGLRRGQSVTRQSLAVFEWDVTQGRRRLKVNPLAAWSEAEVWRFVDDNQVPVNALHAEGFPSIGCAPCSRAVEGWRRGADNDPLLVRSGRWWWESPEHKECGLHPTRKS